MWHARTVTKIDLPRTTNNVESWHLARQKSLSCHHPTIYKLAEQLIKENVRVNAIAIKVFNWRRSSTVLQPTLPRRNCSLIEPDWTLQRSWILSIPFLAGCAHYVIEFE